MSPYSRLRALFDWFAMRPVYIAYRLVWLVARLGHPDALAVYKTMWDAQLDLPPLKWVRR